MKNAIQIGLVMFALTCWAVAAVPPQASQAVQITGSPVVESVSPSSAVIAWSTNTGGSSVVKYGTDPNNLNQTAMSPYETGQGTHRVYLKDLQPNTTYYFQVVSGQGQGTGTQAQSQVGQFQTNAAGGTDKVPFYRAYSPATGSHLFTTDYGYWKQATSSGGFNGEGIAGYIERTQGSGTEPLHRLYNGANHDYLYTANNAERTNAINSGYVDQGIAGYIATSQLPGTVPLYRLRNPKTGEHSYTANPSERQSNLQHGWADEGIAGYIWQH